MDSLMLKPDDHRDPIDDVLDQILSALAHKNSNEHNLAKHAVRLEIVDSLLDLMLERK